MSKSTADLFRWAEKTTARRGTTRWHPKRRNGFAAALAVVVEAGRRGVGTRPLPPVTLSAPPAPRWAVMPRRPRNAVTAAAASTAATSTPPNTSRPGARVSGVAAATVEATAHCPRCGVEGSVDALFGYRKVDGKRRAQSWCRACRRNARAAGKSPLVQEAEDFARTAIDALGMDELPLWSRGSGT